MRNKSAIILLFIALSATAFAQQTYQLDVKKSKLLWTNQKAMGGHFGYIHFNSGSLNYSAVGAPLNGTFKIDMNSMHSTDHKDQAGNDKVDGMLRNPGFFNVAKYSGSVIVIKQILQLDYESHFKVSGDLTMKGITNPIEFIATIKNDGKIISAKADVKFDRSKWNIDMQEKPSSWDLYSNIKNKVLADEISISLDLVLMNNRFSIGAPARVSLVVRQRFKYIRRRPIIFTTKENPCVAGYYKNPGINDGKYHTCLSLPADPLF